MVGKNGMYTASYKYPQKKKSSSGVWKSGEHDGEVTGLPLPIHFGGKFKVKKYQQNRIP